MDRAVYSGKAEHSSRNRGAVVHGDYIQGAEARGSVPGKNEEDYVRRFDTVCHGHRDEQQG